MFPRKQTAFHRWHTWWRRGKYTGFLIRPFTTSHHCPSGVHSAGSRFILYYTTTAGVSARAKPGPCCFFRQNCAFSARKNRKNLPHHRVRQAENHYAIRIARPPVRVIILRAAGVKEAASTISGLVRVPSATISIVPTVRSTNPSARRILAST